MSAQDRPCTVSGGGGHADASALDAVALIVSEGDPTPAMRSEHVKILQLCRHPMAVVEISSELELPVSVVKGLLCELIDTGRITARSPSPVTAEAAPPDPEILKQVLVGLEDL